MKLLNYTSLRYLLFVALLLLMSIPLFYVVLNKIFTKAIDKDLYMQAKEIPAQISVIRSERELALWKALDKDLEILSADSVAYHPKPFTEKEFRNGKKETFRILQKKLHILDKDYIVQIESSVLEKDDLIRTILEIQLGLLLVLLCGAVAINYFINKKVWKPFYRSLSFLQHFNVVDKPGEILSGTSIEEFRQLNQSVTHLTTSVRRAFLSQKEFIENASHELQTPLAKLKFKLELLLQEKDVSHHQHILIGEMYNSIEQLDVLNKNLLLLSRIENGQFEVTESVEVIESVKDIVEDVTFVTSAKSQIIIFRHAVDLYSIQSNRTLFKVLVKNLLLNAIQNAASLSSIHIIVDQQSLSVTNPGTPLTIPPERLFLRFIKSDTQKGNGLGLAIVKAIADLYRFDLGYEYKEGQHIFRVKWSC